MATQQIPLAGALVIADAVQVLMAGSKLRLFVTGYSPQPNETLANLEAVEATFSGYPAGGYPLTNYDNPTFNPTGGVQLVSPQIAVAYTPPGSGSGVSNNIAGYFITDSSGALIYDGLFDNPIPLAELGDGFPISTALVFGTLTALVQAWVYGAQQ